MTGTRETLTAKLVELAIPGLVALYDDQQKLFAYQIKQGKRVPMPLHRSIPYTAMSLLGLLRAREHGWLDTGIDLQQTLDSMISQMDGRGRSGELGLMLWADAHYGGEHRQELLSTIKPLLEPTVLSQLTTMELSWLLIGLCYTYQRVESQGELEAACQLLYKAIQNNFNPETGLLSHKRIGTGFTNLRNQIGNFADQIYTVYAFATFYEVFGHDGALQNALRCANQLVNLQGAQGQWWWHYDSRKGFVVSHYPVFGVHQDGMAPMGLLRLAGVSQQDFSVPIQRGLNWLLRGNELCIDMIAWDRHIIWRDIERKPPTAYLRYLSMVVAQSGLSRPVSWLESQGSFYLNPEMRPYELGWLLYAFAHQPNPKSFQ
jgi:hypothetical protein